MRRGLIEWSKDELPDAAFDRRIAAMREAMSAAKLDALVAYTNFTRPSAVSWLVDFIPYWSECALVLPKSGAPTMVSAVSPRGKPWVDSTTYGTELVFTPKIGPEAARIVKEALAGGGAVGVVELDDVPAAVGLALRASGATVVDATDAFVRARAGGDRENAALVQRATRIAREALRAFDAGEADATKAIAAVDRAARALGAEESYVAVALDLRADRRLMRLEGPGTLGDAYAVRATVAYKGSWVRVIRTVVRDDAHRRVETAAERLAAAVAQLPSFDAFETFDWWLAETARTAQPLEPVAGSMLLDRTPVAAGAFVNVQAAVAIDGVPVLVSNPAF